MLNTKHKTAPAKSWTRSHFSPAFPAKGWTRFGVSLGFTLVELIVVVTILAILATIGFVSYSSYLTGVRDTNRLAQLVSIHDGLELYRTKNDLPLPDNNVEVKNGATTFAYQGYAGSNTLETIDFTKGGKDPKDDTYFSYYLTQDRKYFQLMAFLEEDISTTTQAPVSPSPLRKGLGGGFAHAVDYSSRIPTIYGKKLGILTDINNTPIQEISSVLTAGELDVGSTEDTSNYIAHLSDTSSIAGTATNSPLQYLGGIAEKGGKIATSCKQLLSREPNLKSMDGEYLMYVGANNITNVYCYMTTDGGGWTFFLHVDGTQVGSDFFEVPTGTYMSDRSDTGEHYSLSASAFDHTEMMFTITPTDPVTTSNMVMFKYVEGAPMFNKGPVPCSMPVDFQFKQSVSGTYEDYGAATVCNNSVWYTQSTATNGSYLVLFHATIGGNYTIPTSWNGDGYWYLR